MNRQQHESKIKELFREIRRDDETVAPSFRTVLEGASQSAEASPFSWVNLKTALALLLVVAVILPVAWNLLPTPVSPEPDEFVLLGEWQAPTDFLLDFSEDAFGSSVPDIESDPALWMMDDWTAGEEEDS